MIETRRLSMTLRLPVEVYFLAARDEATGDIEVVRLCDESAGLPRSEVEEALAEDPEALDFAWDEAGGAA